MENNTNTTTETAEPVETQQPQPAQPVAAAEPQSDPKAAVFAELGIDGIAIIGIYTVLYSVSVSCNIQLASMSTGKKKYGYECNNY